MRPVALPAAAVVVVQLVAALALPTLWSASFGPGAVPDPAADLPTAYAVLGIYSAAAVATALWLAWVAARRAPVGVAVGVTLLLAFPAALAGCFVQALLLACAGVF